jgi:hypothetical protein
MSYAIAPTFEANKIGVRRAYTLGRMAGAPDALALQMISDGYDISTITTLTDANATDAQLQNLYDHYGAGTAEFAVAANQLLTQLTGGPGGAASAPSYPQSAVPTTVSSAWGIYDLTEEASWNAISNLFTQVQQQLNSIAQLAPKDPDVVTHVQQFNGLVIQWADYYTKAFGSAPSPLPMASIPGGGSLSGTLGVIPVVIAVAAIAGVAALLAALYAIYTWGQNKKAQLTASAQAQQTAVTGATSTANALLQQAGSLLAQANSLPPAQSAQAAAMRAQAATLQQQAANVVGGATAAVTPQQNALTSWFSGSQGTIVQIGGLLIGFAVVLRMIKKL